MSVSQWELYVNLKCIERVKNNGNLVFLKTNYEHCIKIILASLFRELSEEEKM